MQDYAYTAMAQIGDDEPVLISGFIIATGVLTPDQLTETIAGKTADAAYVDPSQVTVLASVCATVGGLTWSGGAE